MPNRSVCRASEHNYVPQPQRCVRRRRSSGQPRVSKRAHGCAVSDARKASWAKRMSRYAAQCLLELRGSEPSLQPDDQHTMHHADAYGYNFMPLENDKPPPTTQPLGAQTPRGAVATMGAGLELYERFVACVARQSRAKSSGQSCLAGYAGRYIVTNVNVFEARHLTNFT